MRNKNYVIDSFPFSFNEVSTIVILKTYQESERKPNEYARAKLEFIKRNNVVESINGYCDFYEVHFESAGQFYNFFNIAQGNGNRELFVAFAECFANAIPIQKVIEKTDCIERTLLGGRSEGNNPNTIYLFDLRRNGYKEEGERKCRSIENSNKAETLRPYIYNLYKDDIHISFYFKDTMNDELSDNEIISKFANRT